MTRGGRSWPALLALSATAVAATATRIRSNDLWWHLAAGRWILENRSVPRADPFSFTSGGAPWIDHGWLWQVAAYLMEAVAGVPWVALLKMGAAVLFVLTAWMALRRAGWGAHLSVILILSCLAGARFRFADRPEAAGLALLSVFLFFLVARELGRTARLAGAAAVSVLWANVHASALAAPALALAAAGGSGLAAMLAAARATGGAAPYRRRAVDQALAGVVSAAALLVNPYGTGIYLVPFRLREVLAQGGFVNPEWPPPPPARFPFFWSVLLLVFIVAALRIARQADPSTWRGLALAGAAAYLATGSIRHLGIFFVTLPFAAAASGLPGLSRPRATRRALHDLVPESWAPAWALAAAVLFVAVPDPTVGAPGFGVEKGRFPVEETAWIRKSLAPPRHLYNDVAHGGYLIHQLYPEDRVFIDGRNEVHAALLAETAAAVDDGRAWQEMLERHGVQAALVRYRPGKIRVAGAGGEELRTFAPLHFPRSLWALVHWGDAGMVLVRREGPFAAIAGRREYPAVHPEDWEHQLGRCRSGDMTLKESVLRDLRRRLVEDPPSARAQDLYRRFEDCGEE